MEYNHPSDLIKELNFGQDAKSKIIAGVDKLAQAVKSTLGASGKCVIYEDARGNPVITKDGVTVAESVVLYDPVENLGATLIKQAAQNTVKEAGDGTTTATVLAEALIKEVNKEEYANISIRSKSSPSSSFITLAPTRKARSATVSFLVGPKPGKSTILILILPLTLFINNAAFTC